MADFNIRVKIDASGAVVGARQVEGALGKVEDGADRLNSTLKRALAFVGVTAAVKGLLDLADAYTNLQNRLRTVVDGQDQLVEVTEKLFEVANRTRSSFQSTAELYARVALSSKELGVTQQQLIQFTESLNQAIILSGASAVEAQAGLIQLSQGLASGALRGDELRSVLEQLPAVADVIAKQMGVTRGQLRLLGQDGKITADVVLKAFQAARGELEEKFAKTVPTVGQSFVVLKNNVLDFVGSVNTSTGITAAFSKSLIVVADNIRTVTIVLIGLATAILVQMAQRAIPALIVQLGILRTAVLTNPLFLAAGGAAAAVGLLISRFADLDKQIEDVNNTLKEVEDGGLTAFGQVGDQIIKTNKEVKNLQAALARDPGNETAAKRLQLMEEKLAKLTGRSKEYIAEADKMKHKNEELAPSFQNLLDDLDRETQLLTLGTREREAQNKLLAAEQKLRTAGVNLTDQQRAEVLARIDNIQTLTDQNKILEEIKGPEQEHQDRLRTLKELLDQARISQEEFNKAASLPPSQEPQGPQPLPEQTPFAGNDLPTVEVDQFALVLQQIQKEGELLKLSNSERQVQTQLLAAEQQLRSEGVFLSDEQIQQLEDQIRLNQQLAEQKAAEQALLDEQKAAEQALLDELRGPQEQANARIDAANRLFVEGRITADEYAEALKRVQDSAKLAGEDVTGGFTRGFELAIERMQDASSLAQNTVTNAFGAAEDAIAEFAKTGKLNFSSLVDGIVADLARLLARQALGGLFSFFTGALGGGLGAGLGAGAGAGIAPGGIFAEGGHNVGTAPILVGENGPEIWTPPGSGTIIPNDSTQAMLQSGGQGGSTTVVQAPAPQVNVHVVNVTDPKEALSALDTPEGTQKVLNVINRNRTNVKRSLG